MPEGKLQIVAESGKLEELKKLLRQPKYCAQINKPDEWGYYALPSALNYYQFDCANLLLECGADVNVSITFKGFKSTLLHGAIENSILPEVLFLIYWDADLYKKDGLGRIPIKCAEDSPQRETITPKAMEIYLEKYKALKTHLIRRKEAAQNKNKAVELNNALAAANIFVELGNLVLQWLDLCRIDSPNYVQSNKEKFSFVARFFYKEAMPYYSQSIDIYESELRQKNETHKEAYIQLCKKLIKLCRNIHNKPLENYYTKRLSELDADQYERLVLETPAKNELSLSSNNVASFWSNPLTTLKGWFLSEQTQRKQDSYFPLVPVNTYFIYTRK